MLIRNFLDAFSAGKELASAATWKNAQLLVAKLTLLISAGLAISSAFGYTLDLTSDEVVTIASAIGIVGGLFNVSATVVSTKRVGLFTYANGDDGGGGDSGPDEPADKPFEHPFSNT